MNVIGSKILEIIIIIFSIFRNVCTEKYQRICNPYQDKVCRQSYERKCNTLYRNNCYEAYRDVTEPWDTEECNYKKLCIYIMIIITIIILFCLIGNEETKKVCEQIWIDQGNAGKVWGDDPADCKYLKETKCRTVTKTRTVKQAYEKCDKVPYQDCKDVPKQVCELVTKERCNNKPYQVILLSDCLFEFSRQNNIFCSTKLN